MECEKPRPVEQTRLHSLSGLSPHMPFHSSPFASLNIQSARILVSKGCSPHHCQDRMATIGQEKTKSLLFHSRAWPRLVPAEDMMQLKGLWDTVCTTSEKTAPTHRTSDTYTHSTLVRRPVVLSPWCVLCCKGSPGQCSTLVLQTPKPDKSQRTYGPPQAESIISHWNSQATTRNYQADNPWE